MGSGPDGITAGPDGAVWFTQNGTNKIGRITMGGAITETDPLVDGFRPGDITPGPDGRLWFTESEAHRIGAVTTGQPPEVKEYELPLGTDPSGITASGGALWFTMHGQAKIGRMPTFGLPFTEFGPTGAGPSGIALGPDGALWFAETDAGKIGRMTTTGRITEFALPPSPLGPTAPGEIVAGPDGAMWFTEQGANRIGRIEAGSATTTFVAPPPPPPVPGPTTTKKKSTKKKACRVPRVRGLPVRKARKKLRRAKCRYRVRGKGRVVSVRPRAGIRTRSTVQLRARRSAR
jgi:virginiamycin B lyase